MPDLQQIVALHRKYGQKIEGNALNESLKVHGRTATIERRFRTEDSQNGIIEAFSPDVAKEFRPYFLQRKKAEVALLFIDITSFSKKFADRSADQIGKLLDTYYEKVIPIIYECDGEIEKIMGDGIIAVFGPPFLKVEHDAKPHYILHAQACSGKIIHDLKGTDMEVKVAAHFGTIMYYSNPSVSYTDFTVVGNTLTELFRLESVSHNNSFNYFKGSEIDKQQDVFAPIYKEVLKAIPGEVQQIRPGGLTAEQRKFLEYLRHFPHRENPLWCERPHHDVNWEGVDYKKLIQLQKLL